MKLLNEIIELAVDDAIKLSVILRKCRVVAAKLKNDQLKEWVLGELNGYNDKEAMPQYRVIQIHAKGLFLGGFGAEIRDQVLAPGILDEKDRWWASTAYLNEGIAAYEYILAEKEGGSVRVQWPGNLVVKYQSKFIQHYALNRAWQEIPEPAIAALVDSVRNRLLEFSLELNDEIGDTEDPLERVAPERVESVVNTIIYGGQNIIAGGVAGDAQQVGEIQVIKGDFDSLIRALAEVGVPDVEQQELRKAIEEDQQTGEKEAIGNRTSAWLIRVLTDAGKGGAKIAGDVAKDTIKKAVLAYIGLG